MFAFDIKVPINVGILLVVEDIQEYLDSELQIQATQQDIIENAIVALQLDLKNNYIVIDYYNSGLIDLKIYHLYGTPISIYCH